MKATKQRVFLQVKQWVAQGVWWRVFKISAFCLVSSLSDLKESEPCEEETHFLLSWYNLPWAENFKPLFEFQIPPAQNYPAGTSELIPLAPTRIYVEIVRNLDIISLSQNYPAGISELFSLSVNSNLHINSTLSRNFSAGVSVQICVEFVSYVEIFPGGAKNISPLACKFGSM